MAVPRLLLETLEDLPKCDFDKFKWFLRNGVDFTPIPRFYLENADRMDTVDRMVETYGEEMAVSNAVEVLKEMRHNYEAEQLKNSYAAAGTAAPSTSTSAAAPPASPVAPPPAPPAPAPPAAPAAPASMMAQQGSIIIAPNLTGGTSGTWNINITK
ncbi:hypothetical protein VZT92_003157 [Zoarces viviparus]|uniref:Pyrin domain-containing protein n=1 Tax=Zoarces viviparus TaxID=48416 RepID=A0AAW1G0D1_ZOAVI